jgi:hypothetical protein
MVKQTTKTEPDARAVLESLSQTDLAWLLGKPASWVRERPHLFERTAGHYDARQAVSAMAGQFTAATLADELLEPVTHLCADVADFAITRFRPVIELLDSIERRHGVAGLAAVTTQLVEVLRERAEFTTELPDPTAEEIRQRAEDEIDRLAGIESRHGYRRLVTCDQCHRYRWGSKWKSGPLPAGYVVVDELLCPDCESKLSRRQKRRLASLNDLDE